MIHEIIETFEDPKTSQILGNEEADFKTSHDLTNIVGRDVDGVEWGESFGDEGMLTNGTGISVFKYKTNEGKKRAMVFQFESNNPVSADVLMVNLLEIKIMEGLILSKKKQQHQHKKLNK